MVTPAFGFSAGDFIAAINLIVKISKALNDSGGAASKYRMLLQELQQLQLILEQLQDLSPTSANSHSHLNAVKGMALAIQMPLQEFLTKIEKYNSSMCGTSSSSRWRTAPRKAQWAVLMQEEVCRFRAVITMKIVTISVLLALPTAEALAQTDCKVVEQQEFLKETKKAINDSKEEFLMPADSSESVRAYASMSSVLKRRVVSRRTANESSIVWLANFSKEVLDYLKRLHNSNIEIYEALLRIQESVSRAPSGLLSDDIKFVDALGRERSLPYAYFRHQEVFESMLRCEFKGFPGEEWVCDGEYAFRDARQPDRLISREECQCLLLPGVTLEMSMLLRRINVVRQRCPHAGCGGSPRYSADFGVFVCELCEYYMACPIIERSFPRANKISKTLAINFAELCRDLLKLDQVPVVEELEAAVARSKIPFGTNQPRTVDVRSLQARYRRRDAELEIFRRIDILTTVYPSFERFGYLGSGPSALHEYDYTSPEWFRSLIIDLFKTAPKEKPDSRDDNLR
ncbi:hypothetical protein H2201_004753 [Coniosporium apollinis]|uniref:Ubiquitin-like domain-containing protein n=1 Tax=Coniosporium apollinis TaxID=61459 RepID=A0ABQ9NWW6_9PEZI|nr:hypothetical protein H2201_004753 [Coniosporium apollinis]